MADTRVYVGLSLGHRPTHKTTVSVNPYTAKAHNAEAIEWVPTGKDASHIKRIAITLKGANVWPGGRRKFESSADRRAATPALPDRKLGKKRKVKKLSYDIAVAFKDKKGKTRTATIDPDMVIEY